MKTNTWAEEFDNIILSNWHNGAGEFIDSNKLVKQIKNFISKEISKAKKETIEEIMGFLNKDSASMFEKGYLINYLKEFANKKI